MKDDCVKNKEKINGTGLVKCSNLVTQSFICKL